LEHLGHIAANLEPFVRHYGVFAVSLVLAFESLGAPLPGETLLIFASVLTHDVVAGALDLCMGGFGPRRQYWVFDRQDNLPSNDYRLRWKDWPIGLTNARISTAEEIFSRYGSATVLFARFFPVLRQLNGIVAGALGMSWWRFLLFNAIGAALWVGAWVFIATYFSAHAAATAHFANKLIFAAVALGLVILLVRLVVRRLRRDLD